MSAGPWEVLERHRRAGILIDTNILLLLLIGSVDTALIAKHKRTSKFTVEDFTLAVLIAERAATILTTPNILSEVSNLAAQIANPYKTRIFLQFAAAITTVIEFYHRSGDLSAREEFFRYGLTDTGIMQAARDGYLILTDDLRLWDHLDLLGLPTINFTHLMHWA